LLREDFTDGFQVQLLACLITRPSEFADHITDWSGMFSTLAAFNMAWALRELVQRGVDTPSLDAVAQAALRAATKGENKGLPKEIEDLVTDLHAIDVPKVLPGVLAVLDDYIAQRDNHRALEKYMDARIESAASGKPTKDLSAARLELAANLLESHQQPSLVDDGAILLRTDLPVRRTVVVGLLRAEEIGLIASTSKGRKTWLVIDLITSVATGTPWCGFSTRKGKVVHVNFELPRDDYKSRLRAVCDAKGVALEDGLFEVHQLRHHDEKALDEIALSLGLRYRNQEVSLIVIDPLYLLLSGDENSAGDMRAQLKAFGRLARDTGASVVVVHHFAKGNAAAKEVIDRFSGSGVFARYPDLLLMMSPLEEDDTYRFDFTLRSQASVPPIGVRWEYPLLGRDELLDVNAERQSPGKLSGRPKIFRADDLRNVLGKGLTSTDWLTVATDEFDMSEGTFKRLRTELVQKGRIEKINGLWVPC
jgi:hypothetical protein